MAISPAAVADYIHEMTAQLATMADEAGLHLLAYLLNMVRLEASSGLTPPDGGGMPPPSSGSDTPLS